MSNQYVYGIVRDDDALEFETDAVAGADEVYSISHGRFAAVVSDIDTTDPEQTDEDAKRHDEVLREIMETDGGRTVVPMQFGMVFDNSRALKNVLRGGRPAFTGAMRDIEGTVELGLKVVREPDDEVDREELSSDISAELEAIARESVENGLFSDRLVCNRSYLVDQDERETFDETVGSLESDYESLLFKYSGPFAPYSFVDVHIGAQ